MFYPTRPSPAELQAVLTAQRALPLSYDEPGVTRTRAPADGRAGPVNHFRCRVGRGDGLYERAVGVVRGWAMYDLPWTSVFPRGAAVEAGQVVVVQAHHFGFWSLNPCRVVYVEPQMEPPAEPHGERHDPGPAERFAFALGTLPGHSERGEERFSVERRGDEVWFELLAVAGPRHWLTWMGYPLLRRLQRTFARAAAAAVTRAAAAGGGVPHR